MLSEKLVNGSLRVGPNPAVEVWGVAGPQRFHYILSIVSISDSTARTSASISKIVTREMREPCACPALHSQHSSAHRAQHVRPSFDRLGVEQRAPRLRRFKLG